MRQSTIQNHDCDPEKSVVVNNLNYKQKTSKGGKKSNRKSMRPSRVEVNEANPHECDRCLAAFTTDDELLCHQFSFCEEKTR
jgi:hypothetical protein